MKSTIDHELIYKLMSYIRDNIKENGLLISMPPSPLPEYSKEEVIKHIKICVAIDHLDAQVVSIPDGDIIVVNRITELGLDYLKPIGGEL